MATAIAFAPSFAFVMLGGDHFEPAARAARTPRAFLDGAGPAAAGAILGAAVPLLATAIEEPWQWAVLALAAAPASRSAARRCSVLLDAARSRALATTLT